VDPVEGIQKLSFHSGEVGTFILADTLEHVVGPLRAMREIHRGLREDGVVICSSVMHFRSIVTRMITGVSSARRRVSFGGHFFCGSREFPRTVCGVAAKNGYHVAAIKAPAHRGCDIKTTAPLIIEGPAARIIHRLVTKLVPAKSTPSEEISARLDKLAQPGWCDRARLNRAIRYYRSTQAARKGYTDRVLGQGGLIRYR
jgi:hypothetical protein